MAITVTVKVDEDALRESMRRVFDEMREQMREEFRCSCHKRVGETWVQAVPCTEKGAWLQAEEQRRDLERNYTVNTMNVSPGTVSLDHLFAMRNEAWATR